MKKILFVINTLSRAGAEMAMLELFSYFPKEAYAIDLYVVMGQGELRALLPEHVRLLNEEYETSSVLSKEGRRHMKKMVLSAAWKRGQLIKELPYLTKGFVSMLRQGRVRPDKLLWDLLAKGAKRFDTEYDLAVAYLEGGSAYYVADYVKAKKKVAFIHIDYKRAGYTRGLDQSCYLKYDRIFTVSEEGKKRFLECYPELKGKTYLFHNPISRQRIEGLSEESGGFADDYDGLRILTVGRLDYQKAYPVAIDTMKLLKDAGVKARWYVLGEGPERAMLEQKIAELSLQEDFLLLGAVTNPYPYYRQTGLYVHATRYEGRSVAIQEAQLLGCAVIASDCSGNKEQICHGKDGLLCSLSAEALKDMIVRLSGDKEERQRLSENARAKQTVYMEDIQRLLTLADG